MGLGQYSCFLFTKKSALCTLFCLIIAQILRITLFSNSAIQQTLGKYDMRHEKSPRRAQLRRNKTIDSLVRGMQWAVDQHEKRVLYEDNRARHEIRSFIKEAMVERRPAQVGVWKGGCS